MCTSLPACLPACKCTACRCFCPPAFPRCARCAHTLAPLLSTSFSLGRRAWAAGGRARGGGPGPPVPAPLPALQARGTHTLHREHHPCKPGVARTAVFGGRGPAPGRPQEPPCRNCSKLRARALAHLTARSAPSAPCRLLVHVVDGTSPDPMGDFRAIRQELELFNPELAVKPQVGGGQGGGGAGARQRGPGKSSVMQ